MPIVLDSSMAMALSMDDEDPPDADHLLAAIERDGAMVPALWFYEIANSLVNAVRRGRISPDLVATRLALMLALPVDVERHPFEILTGHTNFG